MKTKPFHLAVAVLSLLACSGAFAQNGAQTAAQKSFDQMKSLAGAWQGKDSEGQNLKVTFRSTAGGSALMSEIEGHEDMISMVHLDGPDRLMLTHYCSMGNQPRMLATASSDAKVVDFSFLDATNLATPSGGHMQSVVFTVLDANHHTELWTFNAGPGKQMKEFFDLHRAEVAQK